MVYLLLLNSLPKVLLFPIYKHWKVFVFVFPVVKHNFSLLLLYSLGLEPHSPPKRRGAWGKRLKRNHPLSFQNQMEKAHLAEGASGIHLFFFHVLCLLAWGAKNLGWPQSEFHCEIYADPVDKFMETCTNGLMNVVLVTNSTAHPVLKVILFQWW